MGIFKMSFYFTNYGYGVEKTLYFGIMHSHRQHFRLLLLPKSAECTLKKRLPHFLSPEGAVEHTYGRHYSPYLLLKGHSESVRRPAPHS